jgi:cullin 1
LTVQQIQIYTEIKLEILIQVLKILFKVKLLLCDNNENPLPETVVTYNKDYKHKKFRININVPIRSEAKEEDEKTHRQIDESRKYVIEVRLVLNMILNSFINYN